MKTIALSYFTTFSGILNSYKKQLREVKTSLNTACHCHVFVV